MERDKVFRLQQEQKHRDRELQIKQWQEQQIEKQNQEMLNKLQPTSKS